MFTDLKAELAKVEGAVRSAFGETTANVGKAKSTVQVVDAEALTAFDGVLAAAKKAEATVKSNLQDVRGALERLLT
jgi:hypothetical protein